MFSFKKPFAEAFTPCRTRHLRGWALLLASIGLVASQGGDTAFGADGMSSISSLNDAVPGSVRRTMTLDCTSDFQNREMAWSSEKKDWCCKNKGVGCVALFDCTAGVENAANGWSAQKKAWCCKNKAIGCGDSFDCSAGVENAMVGWSNEKTEWCCKNKNVGCAESFDCGAGQANREIGWSSEKKAWCCKNQGVGCLDDDFNTFGPEDCVTVSRSAKGTCILTTKCSLVNTSNTEFAFVCFNPGSSLPHALHSYGRGGFDSEETFDTGVKCRSCSTIAVAFRTGGVLVRNSLRSLPKEMLPVSAVPAYDDGTLRAESGYKTVTASNPAQMSQPAMKVVASADRPTVDVQPRSTVVSSTVKVQPAVNVVRTVETVQPAVNVIRTVERVQPAVNVVRMVEKVQPAGSMRLPEATYYGPQSCVATFRSPTGTCIVQTRCVEAALSMFNVGITCVDKDGSYARYLFGRNTLAAEEVFDTHMECETCLGVSYGDDPAAVKTTTVFVPKATIQTVNALRQEVAMLRKQVRDLGDACSANRTVVVASAPLATAAYPANLVVSQPVVTRVVTPMNVVMPVPQQTVETQSSVVVSQPVEPVATHTRYVMSEPTAVAVTPVNSVVSTSEFAMSASVAEAETPSPCPPETVIPPSVVVSPPEVAVATPTRVIVTNPMTGAGTYRDVVESSSESFMSSPVAVAARPPEIGTFASEVEVATPTESVTSEAVVAAATPTKTIVSALESAAASPTRDAAGETERKVIPAFVELDQGHSLNGSDGDTPLIVHRRHVALGKTSQKRGNQTP
eukprot:TRINITY_DN74549_c0_g1_i1.p1 TRINITY_DN74549_c0_g1~~TRINITY_DN74549_c0_g1_i1.p1  ORF type:complete len:794 (-),score=126.58 TRINITY_DN74549_c0_g1_i1:128-2509(-)